ncbi:MAG: hypothetical protein KDJ68_02235 [Rhodobiaceae bacterium]|nr:hypothetical protein [Rhodobiaceae bacterium]
MTYRPAILLSALLAMSRPAFAEVCDKEVPNWDPVLGPVTQVEFLMNSAVSVPGMFLLGLFALSVVSKSAWHAVLTAAMSASFIFLIWSNWNDTDGVYAASIEEGCRANPSILLFTLIALMLGAAFIAAMRASPTGSRARRRKGRWR